MKESKKQLEQERKVSKEKEEKREHQIEQERKASQPAFYRNDHATNTRFHTCTISCSIPQPISTHSLLLL